MEITAAVAVVLSAIAGLLGGFAALRQRKTEDATLIVGAMRDHMRTLQDENKDLRERLRSAESTIGDLRVQVAHCDADKNRLRMELDELRREVRGEGFGG